MPQLKTGEENMNVDLEVTWVAVAIEVVAVVGITEEETMVQLNAITAKVKVICLMIALSQRKKDLQDQWHALTVAKKVIFHVNAQLQEPKMKMVPETDLSNATTVVEKAILPKNAQNHKKKEILIVELFLAIIVDKKDMSFLNVINLRKKEVEKVDKVDLLPVTIAMGKVIFLENVLSHERNEYQHVTTVVLKDMYQENAINQWKKDPLLAITAVSKVTYQEIVINLVKKEFQHAITAVSKVTYQEIVTNLSSKTAEEEEEEEEWEVEAEEEVWEAMVVEEKEEDKRFLVTIATGKVIWLEIVQNQLPSNSKSIWIIVEVQWIAMVKKILLKANIKIKACIPIQTSNKSDKQNTVLYQNLKENLIFKEMHLNNKNQLTQQT